MRATGLDVIGSVPWGTHFCQFYQDKQDLIDILVPYFAAGLQQNEFCLWVTSEPLEVEEAGAALAEAVGDLEPYLRSGQLEILDSRQWYTATGKFAADRVLQGWVDKLAAARARGFDGLRLTGNTFWLEQPDWRDFTAHEAMVEGALGQQETLTVCTYPLSRCSASELLEAMANHDFVLIRQGDTWHSVESGERRRAQQEGELTAEFLDLVNRSRDTRDLLQAAMTFFHQRSGCEAVGVRLRDGDDYPYVETRGFPPEFLQAERDLCARDAEGNVLRDGAGRPVLDCMCGSVVCGRFDPARAFFTGHGSYWTNSTSELLAQGFGADTSRRVRNRCHDEGYESVALIPLHLGGEQLGLLQLNDRRKGAFSPGAVGLWERLADHLAVALTKFQAEEALRESQADLTRAQAVAHTGSWRLNVPRNELLWSDEAFRIFGVPPGTALTYEAFLATVHPEDREYVDRQWAAALQGEKYDLEHRIVVGDAVRWVREMSELEFDGAGALLGGFGTVQDITERKQVEQERIAAERARVEIAQTVAAEINHRMKNNLMLLAGLMELQLSGKPEGGAAAAELRQAITRISAMSVVHEHLYEGRSGSVEAKDMFRRIAEIDAQALAGDQVDISVTGDTVFVPSKLGSTLAVLMNELITNAIKHGRPGPNGRLAVEIRVTRRPEELEIRVWNSGALAPERADTGGGLGLQLVRGVVSHQLGGSFLLRAREGGTVAEMRLGERALAPDGLETAVASAAQMSRD